MFFRGVCNLARVVAFQDLMAYAAYVKQYLSTQLSTNISSFQETKRIVLAEFDAIIFSVSAVSATTEFYLTARNFCELRKHFGVREGALAFPLGRIEIEQSPCFGHYVWCVLQR